MSEYNIGCFNNYYEFYHAEEVANESSNGRCIVIVSFQFSMTARVGDAPNWRFPNGNSDE